MSAQQPRNPLTTTEELIIDANAQLQGESCPVCGRTVDVVDRAESDENDLYVVHDGDSVHETDKRSDDPIGCVVSEEGANL